MFTFSSTDLLASFRPAPVSRIFRFRGWFDFDDLRTRSLSTWLFQRLTDFRSTLNFRAVLCIGFVKAYSSVQTVLSALIGTSSLVWIFAIPVVFGWGGLFNIHVRLIRFRKRRCHNCSYGKDCGKEWNILYNILRNIYLIHISIYTYLPT
jgi:hypothetical protein